MAPNTSFRYREALMARQNRRDIFDPNEVGSFHAVQRTVRRAWLCGMDPILIRFGSVTIAFVSLCMV